MYVSMHVSTRMHIGVCGILNVSNATTAKRVEGVRIAVRERGANVKDDQ